VLQLSAMAVGRLPTPLRVVVVGELRPISGAYGGNS